MVSLRDQVIARLDNAMGQLGREMAAEGAALPDGTYVVTLEHGKVLGVVHVTDETPNTRKKETPIPSPKGEGKETPPPAPPRAQGGEQDKSVPSMADSKE